MGVCAEYDVAIKMNSSGMNYCKTTATCLGIRLAMTLIKLEQ